MMTVRALAPVHVQVSEAIYRTARRLSAVREAHLSAVESPGAA
jgi:hypothetical protein